VCECDLTGTDQMNISLGLFISLSSKGQLIRLVDTCRYAELEMLNSLTLYITMCVRCAVNGLYASEHTVLLTG